MFKAVRNDPLEIPVLLGALYGMRRNEIVGLKWSAIDFVQKTITINHIVTNAYINGHVKCVVKAKTKTKSNTRTLPLVAPFEASLHRLKEKQRNQRILCKDSYCLDYLDYVNLNPMGELITICKKKKWLKPLI